MDEKVDFSERQVISKITELSSQLPLTQGKTWAEVLKQDAPPANTNISIECLRKAIAEANEVDKEMEVRSRGIVVYRAEEKVRTREQDKDEYSLDEALIRNLLTFLGCDTDELQSVNRLGTFSADNIAQKRFRPMKVRFHTNEARDRVLSSLSKLRHAPPELNKLSIRQDLNYSQRQELNAKVQEAKEKSKDLVDSVFRVRGTPGSYHLVEVKRNRHFLGQV
ncbi:MAG: hypothetical protein AAFW67_13350 [Cyanobacteria bacterium J06638_38]